MMNKCNLINNTIIFLVIFSLLLGVCFTQSQFYYGPSSICQHSNNQTLPSTWCQFSNPFSTQPQLLFPSDIPSSIQLPTDYWCETLLSFSSDSDICKSIVSIRTIQVSTMLLRARLVLFAAVNNVIYVLKYGETDLPQLLQLDVPPSGNISSSLTSMEIFATSGLLSNYYIIVGQKADTNFSLSVFQLSMPSNLNLVWRNHFSDLIDWKVKDDGKGQPIYAVLTQHYLQFYSSTGSKSCIVKIVSSDQKNLKFDLFYQAGHFDSWKREHKVDFPMRIPSTLNDNIITSRFLILLSDSTQVRLIHLGSIQNGDVEDCGVSVNLDDTKSSNSMRSTFFSAKNYFKNATGVITSVRAFSSAIRSPIVNSDQLTCENVQFAPSQQVYLYVGTRLSDNTSALITVHLEELSKVDFSRLEVNCGDETLPQVSDECVFNPALRPKGYTFSNCKTCAQGYNTFSDSIDYLIPKFIDIPKSINHTLAYDENGYLNPVVLCEAIGELQPFDDSLYNYCVASVASLDGSCEVGIFSLTPSILKPLFDAYWQENIFAILNPDFKPIDFKGDLPLIRPSTVKVVSKTLYLSPDESFGDFHLSLINSIVFVGRILDLHISNNAQHIYASIARLRYEIQSLIRYEEICQILLINPDNLFLQRFKPYCSAFPPSVMDMRQFGMLTSSCYNGVLCKGFDETATNAEVLPGYFVFNHLTQVMCPAGTYCTHGIVNMCPKGFQCRKPGLSTPSPCITNNPEETCYASPLSSIPCPYGSLCPAPAQPPVLAPPGYALWIHTELANIERELLSCNDGDYCPLADQVAVTPDILTWQGSFSSYPYLSEKIAEYLDDSDPTAVLLCPPNLYCENTTILLPEACLPYNNSAGQVVMPYCPAGSTREDLCPAGYYCPSPAEERNCSKTEYCQPGSVVPDVCPAGYYCPNPGLKVRCPKGYFCREGSTSPERCSFLGMCPAGATKDSLTIFAVMIILLVLLVILFAYVSFRIYSFLYAKMSRKQRVLEEQEEEKRKMIKQHRKQISINASRNKNINEESPLVTNSYSGYETESEIEESDIDTHKPVELMQPTFVADIQFEELGLTVRSTGKRVLYGVTGEIKHGELTCVMGLSGAGKSTFITTLAGRAHYGIPEGIVRVNGVQRSLTSFNRRVGFVPQDDIMCRDCTVEETLYFAAKTRLDRKMPSSQITSIVNNVIRVLRLDEIRHSIIGDEENRGISGGQRKRVNVGIELVAQPVILFCDEPTSGLDSASSKEVCEVLQDIARSGITVITVIHQPRFEIFDMFEQLLLLGKGGKTAYLGPVKLVKTYFESLGYYFPAQVNVADYLMDITAGNALPQVFTNFVLPYDPEQLQEKWKDITTTKIEQSKLMGQDLQQTQQPELFDANNFVNPSLSYLRQFWMCFTRSMTQQIRGIANIMQDFFLVFICGLFVGLIFYNKGYIGPVDKEVSEKCPKVMRAVCELPVDDSVFKVASMMNLAMSLTGVMASLKVFGKEKVVFMRESQTGLSSVCFFWSKDLSTLPLNVFAPWIFLVMYYTLFDPRAQLYEIYYTLFLNYYTSYGLGYLVSVVINTTNAQLFAVVIVFILNVFSGSTTSLREFRDMTPPLNILPYTSYLSFGLETNYLLELQYYRKIYNTDKSLQMFGYHWNDLKWMWGAMLGYGIGFRVLAFIALWCSRPDSFVILAKNTISNWTLVRVKNMINSVSNYKVSIINST